MYKKFNLVCILFIFLVFFVGCANFDSAVKAIGKGDATKLRQMVKSNPKLLNEKDKVGINLIGYTIFSKTKKDNEILEILLEAGADPEAGLNFGDGNEMTPLYAVATDGDIEKAEILIRYKADVNCKCSQSPVLLSVVQKNDLNMTELLLKNGADPNKGISHLTPLGMAKTEEMKALLKRYKAFR